MRSLLGGAATLVLAALLGGCGGGAPPPSASSIVSRSAAATAKQRSFHVIVDIENVKAPATGMSLTSIDGDLIVPDRMRARVTGTFQGVPLRSELIVVGSDFYLKNPFSGAWQRVDVGTNPVAFFDPAEGVLAVIRGAVDLAHDGSERVDDVDCYRLTGKVRDTALKPLLGNAGSGKLVPLELWIGKDDSLLRRIRLSGPLAPSEDASAVRTVDLSAYGERVRIVAPATS